MSTVISIDKKLRRSKARTPKAKSQQDLAEELFQEALRLEDQDRTEPALDFYHEAFKNDPSRVDCLLGIGTIELRRGNLLEAIFYYRTAIGIDPEDPVAFFNLAFTIDEIDLFREEAMEYYLRATELDPDYANAYFNLGILYGRNNEILEAIACFEQYIKITPKKFHKKAEEALAQLQRHLPVLANKRQELQALAEKFSKKK